MIWIIISVIACFVMIGVAAYSAGYNAGIIYASSVLSRDH